MPTATSKITVIPLHETFCAQVQGVDFSQPIPADIKEAIQAAIDKYGVLIFRETGLLQTDDADDKHAAFASLFGELDDMSIHLKVGRKLRLKNVQMFDVSNLDSDGNLVTENDPARLNMMKGNNLWHADLAFNSRRSGYSILRGTKLPPKGTGGDTEVHFPFLFLCHLLIVRSSSMHAPPTRTSPRRQRPRSRTLSATTPCGTTARWLPQNTMPTSMPATIPSPSTSW